MNITLYNFKKKDNSTMRPTSGTGTGLTGSVVEPCTVIAPRIKFTLGATTGPGYNYAYIPEFSRYYWIKDWTWSEGFWTADMEVDVLATARSQIGQENEYVLRSSAEGNTNLIDTLYPATCYTSCKTVNVTTPFVSSLGEGSYIIGVISSESGIGAQTNYALNADQFNRLNNIMLSGVDWLHIDFSLISGITDSLLKTLFNPYQYVVSCFWIPLPISLLTGTSVTSIKYGWWEIDVSGKKLNAFEYSGSASVNIPGHPQNAQGYYLNFDPYTQLFLDWPVFGNIPINTEYYYAATLNLQYSVDLITGQGILRFPAAPIVQSGQVTSDPGIHSSVSSQVGVPISFAQMATNILGSLQSGFSGAAGAIGAGMSGNIAGMATGIINAGIESSINMIRPQTNIIGSNGSLAGAVGIYSNCVLTCFFKDVVEKDPQHNGYPLCRKKVLNTIPGFIMTGRSSIVTGLTLQEDIRIREHMEGGFYYE